MNLQPKDFDLFSWPAWVLFLSLQVILMHRIIRMKLRTIRLRE